MIVSLEKADRYARAPVGTGRNPVLLYLADL
jgi:hypothetical protein